MKTKRSLSILLAAGLLTAMIPVNAAAAPVCGKGAGAGWTGVMGAELGPNDVGNIPDQYTDLDRYCAKTNKGLSKKLGLNVYVVGAQYDWLSGF